MCSESCQLSVISYQGSVTPVGDFKSLKVWQKAHRLALGVYAASATFPKDELYGLTSQIRRCSVSIPANIAEGCGRNGDAELARFANIALGSASELDYHLLLARDLGLLSGEAYGGLTTDVSEVRRMLASLVARLRSGRAPATDS